MTALGDRWQKKGGVLRKSAGTFAQRVKWTAFRLRLIIEDRRNRAFDAEHNVETAGEMSLEAAGVGKTEVQRGNTFYRATWERLIRRAIEQLGVDYSRYTFVDYGAGKGKAMFVAADYPFKRIVGVEYAPHLHAITRHNCESFRGATQRCFRLEAFCGDALNYELPAGPVVCFMCNPFDQATLQCVFDAWCERSDAGERDIRILYLNMRNVREVEGVLAAQTWLRVEARNSHFVLLTPRSSDAAVSRGSSQVAGAEGAGHRALVSA